jgi:hypothetical protein
VWNLLRAPEKEWIQLIDFGLAKQYINTATGKHIPFTTEGDFAGTMRYMSPVFCLTTFPSRQLSLFLISCSPLEERAMLLRVLAP